MGWRQGSAIEYQEAYNKFGGSIITSPEILNFIHTRFDLDEKFYIKKDKDNHLHTPMIPKKIIHQELVLDGFLLFIQQLYRLHILLLQIIFQNLQPQLRI